MTDASLNSRKSPTALQLKMNALKLRFNKISRAVHAYLSAFAFLALMFFSVTGLLVNHPDWFSSDTPEEIHELALPQDALTMAMSSPDMESSLANLARQHGPVLGQLTGADVFDDEAYLRFTGPKGRSEVVIDLASGDTEVSTRRATLVDFMGDLHRGKDAGAAWKLLIDVSAVLIFVMSLFGFFLFFLIRFRRRTSLYLIGLSLLVLAGVGGALVV